MHLADELLLGRRVPYQEQGPLPAAHRVGQRRSLVGEGNGIPAVAAELDVAFQGLVPLQRLPQTTQERGGQTLLREERRERLAEEAASSAFEELVERAVGEVNRPFG